MWVGHALYKSGNQNLEITMRLKEDVIDFIHIESNHDEDKLLEKGLFQTQLTSKNIAQKVNHYVSSLESNGSRMDSKEWIEALMMIKNEQNKISGGT